jgi:hypothetical protein
VFLLYTSAPHRPITASAAARQNEKSFVAAAAQQLRILNPISEPHHSQ